ncbi:MAG: sulfur oxidation c-type cytochrome SoxA [Candidatus Rokubacteria bacterium]|nr:sulfur oxidation c-type cytochrome SoxA [Candidatus Rokubacteria bacterium]
MIRPARVAGAWVLVAALAAGCSETQPPDPRAGLPPTPWVTRATAEARGEVKTLPDGKRQALRYKGWSSADFGQFRTYAYDDTRPEPRPGKAPMPAAAGDPKKGRSLFLARAKGPCTGCHLIQGQDVWPAGNMGPDLSTFGDRGLTDEYVFNLIYDPRHIFPNTTMPPWGTSGMLAPGEVMDLVAFLKTQKGPPPPERDRERNPNTRPKPPGFGDNLDSTNNPAVVRAEAAEASWARKGPAGKSCADCHPGGPGKAMKGVATHYPKYVQPYRRVMSIEDFLTVHAPETTGTQVLAQSAENLDMTILVKMASNGMPVALDLSTPEHRAAFERGRASFHKRVGQRNHACADCHTTGSGRGAERFLGGRLLGNVENGLTRHFPTWRTSQAQVWDMRKRMQWCLTPLGMNMLPADAVEYAELELYLTSFDQGEPLSVPGIRH